MSDFVAAHLSNNDVGVDVIKLLMEKEPLPTCMHECLKSVHLTDNIIVLAKLDFLLETYRAGIHAKDSDGNIPLHIAVKKITTNNILAIKKLKVVGAKFDVPNNANKTPKDVAQVTMADFKQKYLTHPPIFIAQQDTHLAFKNICNYP